MKFSCSHCGQNLEAGEEWLGHATDCPACGGNFVVVQLSTTKSPVIAASPPVSLAKKSGGIGFGKILWLLVFLTFGAFNYAMVRMDESPQQVWKRLLDWVHVAAHSRMTSASALSNSDALEF
ncbi:MAG: hypothetical protein WCD79_04155 [Chthoniobacteraceae bacterium]